ncbi:hypothetical protein M405DRAFT_858424, partial [Rhizopogon salebrosus TDB-379]
HDPIEDPATWTYQDRLYALHGPNAALYLSDDCDSCNSEPEIEEVVPFVADPPGSQFEPCDVAPCALAGSVPDSLSTSTDKEVFAFDADLFGLEFPVDETVGFPSEDPILINLDFALEDSAPDPTTLCSGLSQLEGLMFDAPREVPRYPPGLSHIPQARIRSHWLPLIDVASDMTLPSLGLMFDIDAYDQPHVRTCVPAHFRPSLHSFALPVTSLIVHATIYLPEPLPSCSQATLSFITLSTANVRISVHLHTLSLLQLLPSHPLTPGCVGLLVVPSPTCPEPIRTVALMHPTAFGLIPVHPGPQLQLSFGDALEDDATIRCFLYSSQDEED